jgi:benzoate membrane transport protein
MRSWFKVSHISAGFIAVLVGYTSSVAIVFQAAYAAGATPEQLNSWMWALGIGMAASCIGLSLRYRSPVLTAWSTPGAALLATSLQGLSMNQAVGVFLFSSLLIVLSGITGWFQKLMQHMPRHLAGAMLAGILLRFGMDLFAAMQTQLALVLLMFVAFLAGRLWLPRYTVPLALAVGIAGAAAMNLLHLEKLTWSPALPVFTMPVGIPLFIVTMTSQNIPGLAVLRANGYQTPASPLINWTGALGVVLAPFGGFAFNLAAITAAICMSRDADPDPAQRYKASIWAGLFYLLTGIFGATVVALFAAFPTELIAAIAGLALIGTIANSLHAALDDECGRESALVTFLCTASGLSISGIGSAFWGLLFGLAVHALARRAR